jgi:hypothetical protein
MWRGGARPRAAHPPRATACGQTRTERNKTAWGNYSEYLGLDIADRRNFCGRGARANTVSPDPHITGV